MPINNPGNGSGGGGSSVVWGGITGSLPNQADLNTSLTNLNTSVSAKQSQSALLDAIVNNFATASAGTVPTVSGSSLVYANKQSQSALLDAIVNNFATAPAGSVPTVSGGSLVYAVPSGGGGTSVIVPSHPRQSIRTGLIDANGLPAYITAGTGLQAILNASTGNPFIGSFADGFDSTTGQALDRLSRLTANQTFTLTDASTNYLYLARATDGTITAGATTLQPVYSSIAPASPASGQPWFDLVNWQAKTWDGVSSWVASPRLYVGEAVTSGGAVTSVTSYKFNATCSGTRCPLLVPPGVPCEIFTYNQVSTVTGTTALTQFPGINFTIPAGWCTPNTAWELDLMISTTSNSNAKQLTCNFGSGKTVDVSIATVLGDRITRRIVNKNSLTAQSCSFGNGSSASYGTFTGAGSSPTTLAVNTAAAIAVNLTMTLAASTDTASIAHFLLTQINP